MPPLRTALRRVTRRRSDSSDPPGIPRPDYNPVSYSWYYDQIMTMGESQMWRTQPQLRTVVDFLARNIAQLGVHTFARQADNDRVRILNSPAAMVFNRPNPESTCYELIHALVADLAVYDKALWYVTKDADAPSGSRITRMPPAWIIGIVPSGLYGVKEFIIQPDTGQTSRQARLPADRCVYFHGWNPDDPKFGDSPLQALRETLAEQTAAQQFRNQNRLNGARMQGVIERPVEAPEWSDKAKTNFKQSWRDSYVGRRGTDAGGTPILEDGMVYKTVGFSAADNQFVETAKLSLGTVCGVYHINPIMVGDNAGANYSNVREFRKALYGDTLGPTIAQIEARINAFLLPLLAEPPHHYLEFNIAEKLQGNFEDQAAALQMATGGPWLTVNEARAKNNLSHIGQEYDEVITPLNVIRGGGPQASPQDSAPAPEDRTGPGDSQPEQQPKAVQAKDASLEAFLGRQRRTLTAKLGANPDVATVWNDERWNAELSWFLPAEEAATANARLKAALTDALSEGFSAAAVADAFSAHLTLTA